MKRIFMLAIAAIIAAPGFAAPVLAQNVATVNGDTISQKKLDQYVQFLVARGGANDSPQLREQIKQEMIKLQVLAQTATKKKIDQRPEVQTEIELERLSTLGRTLMADHLKAHPISATQVQAEYNRLKRQQTDKSEYLIRHILVKDETTANALLKRIQDGEKFDILAKANSIDPGSAEKGGELGWAPATRYLAPFAQAVTSLKKGELLDKPVQTQYGWHIIQVQDMRAIEFPPFEQLRPQIEEMLRQQLLMDYQKSLMDKAAIKTP